MQHKHIQVLWCAVMDVMILVRPATLATPDVRTDMSQPGLPGTRSQAVYAHKVEDRHRMTRRTEARGNTPQLAGRCVANSESSAWSHSVLSANAQTHMSRKMAIETL